jgi:aspartate aminotransferase-like enzyme
MDAATCRDGAQPMIYHRTAEFSACVSRCEEMLKQACSAASDDRVMMLTASGTAAMEAAVLNLFAPGDRVLVVNGGDFGQRFADICRVHALEVTEVRLKPGRQLREADLVPHKGGTFAGLLVNHNETSTGLLLDLALASRFCREQGIMLIVDAIGSFLADPLRMAESGIDALIFSSQKALALPPGLAFVVLSGRAQEKVRSTPRRSYYFDFRKYLDDIVRGQTPFTPAVGLIRQLERRLGRLLATGVDVHVGRIRDRAEDFRRKIRRLPFRCYAECQSNAVTALEPLGRETPEHFVRLLQTRHTLFVCPNGGPLGDRIFRVGHLGDLLPADNTRLYLALANIVDYPAEEPPADFPIPISL